MSTELKFERKRHFTAIFLVICIFRTKKRKYSTNQAKKIKGRKQFLRDVST